MMMLLYERMFEPVRHLHRLLDEGHERWTLSKDLFEILGAKPQQPSLRNANNGPVAVMMKGVSFCYPRREQPTIDGANVEIHAGQRIAVVGQSGSGKSTFARLLAGLILPSSGTILVGGIEPHGTGSGGRVASIGYMTQEPYLFAGSVGDNVRFARPDATDEAISGALELAGLTSITGHSVAAEHSWSERQWLIRWAEAARNVGQGPADGPAVHHLRRAERGIGFTRSKKILFRRLGGAVGKDDPGHHA